jgi:hypothetical protein
MNVHEKILKQGKEAGATPDQVASAIAWAERAADAKGFDSWVTEATRESVRKYCAFRNRN